MLFNNLVYLIVGCRNLENLIMTKYIHEVFFNHSKVAMHFYTMIMDSFGIIPTMSTYNIGDEEEYYKVSFIDSFTNEQVISLLNNCDYVYDDVITTEK